MLLRLVLRCIVRLWRLRCIKLLLMMLILLCFVLLRLLLLLLLVPLSEAIGVLGMSAACAELRRLWVERGGTCVRSRVLSFVCGVRLLIAIGVALLAGHSVAGLLVAIRRVCVSWTCHLCIQETIIQAHGFGELVMHRDEDVVSSMTLFEVSRHAWSSRRGLLVQSLNRLGHGSAYNAAPLIVRLVCSDGLRECENVVDVLGCEIE